MNRILRGLLIVALVLVAGRLLATPGTTKADESSRPNVLLITIDTLRADHLSAYGYRLPTSPNIDRLAERGVLFTDCTVQWPKTWPSLASLLSGMYPRTTGLRIEMWVLPSSLRVLSEIFAETGYATAAVVANINAGTLFGFDKGFSHFRESWLERWGAKFGDRSFPNRPGKTEQWTDAGGVTDQALDWLREQSGERPFFLWLHYQDPHGPYLPPRPYREFFTDTHPSVQVPIAKIPGYQRQHSGKRGKVITDLGFYKTQYDREIRYLDDEVGRLIDELEDLGILRNTLLVLTADHGESLGEHDYYLEHGKFSYQANAHVPLLMVWDGRLPPQRMVDAPVGLIDVAPTLLDLVGIPIPFTFEGQSLAMLATGKKGARAPAYVFMESGTITAEFQLTVRSGKWKLIKVQADRDRRLMCGTEYELYDVLADPDETVNLAAEYLDVVARLGEVLDQWYSGLFPLFDVETVDPDTLDQKTREMLRSLGYID